MTATRWSVLVLCCATFALVTSMDVGAEREGRFKDFEFGESMDIAFDEEPELLQAEVETDNKVASTPAGPGFWRRALARVLGSARVLRPQNLGTQALRMNNASWSSTPVVRNGRDGGGNVVPFPAASARREVLGSLGCDFYFQDTNEDLWDITYEARLYDPSDNQLAYATNWTAAKPAYSSSLRTPVVDPPEGTYKCTILWTVNNYQFPLMVKTLAVSYAVPTGETTSAIGWATMTDYRTAHMWNVVLTGASNVNFKGRVVKEEFGGSVTDTCYHSYSIIDEKTTSNTVLNTQWAVKSDNSITGMGNQTGLNGDWVGWTEFAVNYYRGGTGDANRAPCTYTLTQDMKINRPGIADAVYASGNVLIGGINSNTVSSSRAGQSTWRSW